MRGHVVVFEGDDASSYSAYSPDLPGVVAAGDTRTETEQLMRGAEHIAMHHRDTAATTLHVQLLGRHHLVPARGQVELLAVQVEPPAISRPESTPVPEL